MTSMSTTDDTMQQALPVSVILPTYNRTAVLRRAIRSVLAQTFAPAEVIVVDDASTEDVGSLVASFEDTRIRHLRLERQSGPGVARNHGVMEARHEWVAFQDSDDEWLINKLERQWSAALGVPDVALVCGAYVIVPRRGTPRLVAPSAGMQEKSWPVEARFAFPFIAPTWFLRRDVYLKAGGFNTNLPNLEDWEFSFRMHDYGRVIALQDILLIKHGSADGLNKDLLRSVESMRQIQSLHAPMLNRSMAVRTEFLMRRARLHLRLRDRAAVRQIMHESLRVEPSARNAVLYLGALLGGRAFRLLSRLLYRPAASG